LGNIRASLPEDERHFINQYLPQTPLIVENRGRRKAILAHFLRKSGQRQGVNPDTPQIPALWRGQSEHGGQVEMIVRVAVWVPPTVMTPARTSEMAERVEFLTEAEMAPPSAYTPVQVTRKL